MRISDLITQMILEQIETSADSSADIRRNELAGLVGCVPSQINYVITNRFTQEQGYIVESRRGGGGYIRITRVELNRTSAIMHLINSIGPAIDSMAARVIIENLFHHKLVDKPIAALLSAAVSNTCYREVEPARRDQVRASVLKQMLLTMV